MAGIKRLPITLQDLIEKIHRFSVLKDYKVLVQEKNGYYEIKIFNSGPPGLLRIYTTAKGLTVDDSCGKNKDINSEVVDFVVETIGKSNASETRETFRNVSDEMFRSILEQINDFFGGSECYEVTHDTTSCVQVLETVHVKDLVNKEESHVDFYHTGTVYVRGFSWHVGEEILNIVSKVTGKIIQRKADLLNVMIHTCHEDFVLDLRTDCEKCQNGCGGNQASFMRKIHFGGVERYPCSRVADYYFTRFSYRYSFEFENILNKYNSELSKLSEWNILSFGCGPCTDLLGIQRLQPSFSKKINYNGIDLNPCWRHIHHFLSEILFGSQIKLRFHNEDFFDFIARINPHKGELHTNIVSFQYVISDLLKYHSDVEIIEFMKKCQDEVFAFLPKGSLIIINDINSKILIYKTLMGISELLLNHGYLVDYWHFGQDETNQNEFGTSITTCYVSDEIPPYIEKKYNPWVLCKSAAVVFRKV